MLADDRHPRNPPTPACRRFEVRSWLALPLTPALSPLGRGEKRDDERARLKWKRDIKTDDSNFARTFSAEVSFLRRFIPSPQRGEGWGEGYRRNRVEEHVHAEDHTPSGKATFRSKNLQLPGRLLGEISRIVSSRVGVPQRN